MERKLKSGNFNLCLRGIVRLVLAVSFIGAPLFLGAGTFSWVRGWLFIALLGGTFVFNLSILAVLNPTLIRERWKKRNNTKKFDKIFGLAYFISNLALFTLAGLDSVRYQWTVMWTSLLYFGIGLHALGLVPVLWSMITNPHLETTVRIQEDRNHRVISAGPYRYVRHPMYTGVILMFLGWPFVLGSWVAFVVACCIVCLFFIRTNLEDKTLQQELAGYRDFCETTRYRLLPGLW